MLNRETFRGLWAGLPVAWAEDGTFDEVTYRNDVEKCCLAGMPGVYSGGTTGEFYAMEFEEFKQVAKATVEICHDNNRPAMVGCTSTYNRGAMMRADYAASLGADAIQVALPFWMEVPDSEILTFFKDVSSASGGIPLSIYETTRAKKTLSLEQHLEIKEAIPNYLMVKSNANTLGDSREGCKALSEIVNVFVSEHRLAELGPVGAAGGCSSLIYYNPRVLLTYWENVENKNWDVVNETCKKINAFFSFLGEEFDARGFTDSADDSLGGISSGFLGTSLKRRAPYPHATQEDVLTVRKWYETNFPEMLDL